MNGDGELQYSEFMTALRGQLQGLRRKFVQYSYYKLDTAGTTDSETQTETQRGFRHSQLSLSIGKGRVPLTHIVRNMRAAEHSDVAFGTLSAEQVLTDFIDYTTVNQVCLPSTIAELRHSDSPCLSHWRRD